MKKGRLIRNFILVIIFSFIISACSFQKDVNVKSVEIIEETVPEFIVAGKFDEAGIEALITYDDGTTETVEINSSLLKDMYQEELNTPGDYELEILLKDKIVKLNIKIIEQNIVHEVKFFNGYNELVSLQMVKDGEDAIAPKGTHLIPGFDFIGWDRTFTKVKEDISVYGIYIKVNYSEEEQINLESKLLNVASSMQQTNVNLLYMQEDSPKRLEQTHHYDKFNLREVVEKTTTADGSVTYSRQYKEKSSNASENHYMEVYDKLHGYSKFELSQQEFIQNEIYGQVKELLVNADSVQEEVSFHKNNMSYKLQVNINNDGIENYHSDTYEFIFNDKQIIYLKHYRNFATEEDRLNKELLDSTYYFVDLGDEDFIRFPLVSVVEDIASKFLQGIITTQETTIETEHFTFKIDSNVYIPGYLEKYIEVLYDTLEIVSDLDFYNEHYNPGKIKIHVGKPDSSTGSEVAGAYAYSKGAEIFISSGDLLLGNSYAIAHELSHILMYSQSSWTYSQVYVEGFAEYTAHKAIKYLEKNNIEVANAIEDSSSNISNMKIHGDIYAQTIEYWIENPKEAANISINGGYAVGFRFMSYLDHIYDNYSEWVYYYEEINPYHTNKYVSQETSLQIQFEAMEQTYGEDVFDGFYSWLRLNEEELFPNPLDISNDPYDLTKLKYAYVFPYFYNSGNKTSVGSYYKFKYDNLYVGIDEIRNYLQNYKGKDVSDLKMKLEHEVKVELYDSNNNLIETRIDNEFSLVGVSYIKLVGQGTLGYCYTEGLEILY